MRRSLLTWWQEKLGLSVLADLKSILPEVEQALQALQAKGRTGKTLTSYVDSLVAFCRWCATKSRGYLKENPLEGIGRFDTTPRTRRRAMTAEEIQKLLSVATEYRRLLYEVAFCSGLRANELRSLSVDHLDRERGGLHLDSDWTKDRKAAFQPLPRALVDRLAAFAEQGTAKALYSRHFGQPVP
jgi:site-specific recombinase XerC